MSDLKTRFETAADDVTKLPERPDQKTLLKLYALYKQATQGDATGERPGFMDFVGRAKYDAWAEHKGKTQEEAMQAYIDYVEELKAAAAG